MSARKSGRIEKGVSPVKNPVLAFVSVLFLLFMSCSAALADVRVPGVKYGGPFVDSIKYMVVHHSEVRASTNSCQLHSINEYHREKFGMYSELGYWVGYNWLCDVDGTLTQTRLVGEETAAQLWHNDDSESICLAGDFDIDRPNDAQIRVLRKWILARPHLMLRFHRDLAERACPGKHITKAWIKNITGKDFDIKRTGHEKKKREKDTERDNGRTVSEDTTVLSAPVPATQLEDEFTALSAKRKDGTATVRERIRLELLRRSRSRHKDNCPNCRN